MDNAFVNRFTELVEEKIKHELKMQKCNASEETLKAIIRSELSGLAEVLYNMLTETIYKSK
jgi:hypothetical protein